MRKTTRIEIRKPTTGAFKNAFGNSRSFGRGRWISAEARARSWRDLYADGELIGWLIKDNEGDWYVEIAGRSEFEIKGGLRSMAKATAQIKAHLREDEP